MASESRHENLVAKVGQKNAEHLEPDEQVEQAVGDQTGPIHSSAPLALVDVVRRLSGQLQSRLVILTDRNLHVTYPGFFGQFEIHEVKAKYPRVEAGKHVRALARGALLEIDGEQIHFPLATMKFVRRLVETAGGAGGEAADLMAAGTGLQGERQTGVARLSRAAGEEQIRSTMRGWSRETNWAPR